MSIWTHVAAVVRIDDLQFLSKTDWREYFGYECTFNAESAIWKDATEHPEKYLPMGSEGSLKSSLWTNPDDHSLAAYTLSIFGDLRDYDTPGAIIDWFKEKLENIPMVRQAVITVQTECVDMITYTYSTED